MLRPAFRWVRRVQPGSAAGAFTSRHLNNSASTAPPDSDSAPKLPPEVTIVEVGPRDGLQNERTPISAESKIGFVNRLAAAGLRRIEAVSFVSPKWVPQMADGAAVMAGVDRPPGVRYMALVPNLKGLEGAVSATVHEVAVFASASETFSQRNINCTIAESIERFRPACAAAAAAGLPVRGYISCALGCPFEGAVPPAAVGRVAEALLAVGCGEICVADTVGAGTPRRAAAVLRAAAAAGVALPRLAAHFHDTYGQALANILTALELGVATVDAAAAGLGGCPYAPGATGNVATEDVVYMLEGCGVRTGVDLERLLDASDYICGALGGGRLPAAGAARALLLRRRAAASTAA